VKRIRQRDNDEMRKFSETFATPISTLYPRGFARQFSPISSREARSSCLDFPQRLGKKLVIGTGHRGENGQQNET
jgi:hypothetical protein